MKTAEILVTEENGIIRVRPRMVAGIVIFLCGILLAAGLLLLSRMLRMSDLASAFGSFSLWGAAAVIGLSFCVLLAGAFVRLTRKVTLDAASGTLRKGAAIYHRATIKDIVVSSIFVMEREILTVVARTDSTDVLLVSGHSHAHRESMMRVAQRMNALMGMRGVQRELATPRASAFVRRMPGVILIGLGAVISGTGWILIPDLVLTRPGLQFGALFWPVGIWIAGAGILTLTRVAQRRALRVLILAVWFASYFLVCLRRLG